MAKLHLSLLGGFEFGGEGVAAAPIGRKARGMIAYLAMQRGHGQSREKLAATFWGNHQEAQARTSLRQALSSIRRALPAMHGSALLADGDEVALRLDCVEFDVARFEDLAASTTPDDLDRAVSLYRGDLLDGFSVREESFEEWLRPERERLRAIAIGALERLAALRLASADAAAAIAVAGRLLTLDPLREDMHRLLMRAYAGQGRTNMALRQYEACRDALQRQFGLRPEKETRELFDELRSRRGAFATENSPTWNAPPTPSGDLGPGFDAAPRHWPEQRNRPQTRYVKSDGCNIAYQVTGEGPIDLLYVPGWVSNLDWHWGSPRVTRLFDRLGSFARLIRIDKRGTGLSDRGTGLATFQERIEDVRAVLDAIGSRHTVIFGSSEGGIMCMLFAATYPERTAALVLHGAYACGLRAEGYPWARTREQREDDLALIEREWGRPADLTRSAPSLMDDAAEREWFAAFLRNSASPADALALWRWSTEVDVRDVLPAIHVPTLILHKTGDRWVHIEEGRYLARHIAGAKLVEMPGEDHLIWGQGSDRLVDELKAFVVDARRKSAFAAALPPR